MRQSIRIVLCDDDAAKPQLFNDIIRTIDYPVELASFDEAAKLLRHVTTSEAVPDLIFLDLNMPDMSGFACIEFIRAFEHLRHVPIVIHSPIDNPEDEDAAYALGANLCAPRTFTPDDLRQLIVRVIAAANKPLLSPETLPESLYLN